MLTTFQQWYLIWLFPTLILEKRKKINNLVAITIITELANTIYMYKSECYIYDGIFIGIIIIFMFFKIVFDKIIINYKKGLTNETKQKV